MSDVALDIIPFYLDKWPGLPSQELIESSFLSVAMQRQKTLSDKYDHISWCHGNMESPPSEWRD